MSPGAFLRGQFGAIPNTLAHRNFGIYVAGNSISLTGTWMQRVGVGWLAWDLSGSGTVLGLVAFCDLFPAIVIGPFGGALADRIDRKRMIVVAQALMMAQAAALFALTASGVITVPLLLAAVLCSGVVIGFNQPARLALVPSLVPRADLATAVAINSIVFNTARFIGPALAGIVIVTWGVAAVFALNALSYLAFQIALARLRLAPADAAKERASMLSAVAEGLRYTAAHPGIGPLLLLQAVVALGARPFVELMPGFAAEVFGRGAPGLAVLSSTVGIGAIVAGLWLTRRPGQTDLARIAMASSALTGLATMGFALSAAFPLAVLCVGLAGVGMVVAGVGTQTVLQTSVDETMRGRVLSLFGLIFRGGPALGALLMGVAADLIGLRAPLVAGCLITLAAWLWIWRRRRPIVRSLTEPIG